MIINNIVYSEKFHIVALFKDYLISDNLSEFLKRSITKILYTSLPEAKFIYKYIHKTKNDWLQQAMEESQEIKIIFNIKKNNFNDNNKYEVVFSTDVFNSIVNVNENLYNLLFGIENNNYILE